VSSGGERTGDEHDEVDGLPTVTAGLGWPDLTGYPRVAESLGVPTVIGGGIGWPEFGHREAVSSWTAEHGGGSVSRETVDPNHTVSPEGVNSAVPSSRRVAVSDDSALRTAGDSRHTSNSGMEAKAVVDLVGSEYETGGGGDMLHGGAEIASGGRSSYREERAGPSWADGLAGDGSGLGPVSVSRDAGERHPYEHPYDPQSGRPDGAGSGTSGGRHRSQPFVDDDLPPSPTDVTSVEVPRETLTDTPIAAQAQLAVQVLHRSGPKMPRPAHTRILVVANQKGGVGKTTTTVNLAASLAIHGAKVLVIDLDPQGNASTALGIDHHAEVPSIYDVLVENRPLAEVIQPVREIDGLFCAPATIDLAGAEIELVSLVARESRLERALAAFTERFDYIFVDCPPSLGLLTVNALVAGDEVLIPIQCEYYALEGLGQLLRNVDLVRGHLNQRLNVSTILLTMYDARTRLAAQVADEVRTHFPDSVLKTTIPRSVRISEAPSYGQTVMTYDPGSSGALSYLEAAREMAERGAPRGAPGYGTEGLQ
jgi:chromosome partitioning protein